MVAVDRRIVLFWTYKRRKNKKKRLWVHPILRRRDLLGEYHRLVKELEMERKDHFIQYFRLTPDQFTELARLIAPLVKRVDTNWRKAISVEERLAITLRFLSTGDSYTTIGKSYRVGQSTISGIVPETCQAIYKVLQPMHMAVPTKAEWTTIASDFWYKWQFPNCLGSIDGKHIALKCPANAGSKFFNYKGYHSIILLAVVDAEYRFRLISVGSFGRQSDGGVFTDSAVGFSITHNLLDLPEPKSLPGRHSSEKVPMVFIGDEAFPLRTNLLRPYPGRNLSHVQRAYNYRLSRARRTVENAFGILAQRFRVFLRPLAVLPETVDDVVRATCCLHNYLRVPRIHPSSDSSSQEASEFLFPFREIRNVAGNASRSAMAVRDYFANYFSSPEGCVAWQSTHID